MMTYWQHILIGALFCIVLETIVSHENVTLASRLRGALYWFIYVVITASALALFNALWSELHLHPLVTIDVSQLSRTRYPALHVISWIVAPVTAGIIGEFFYYWFHRAQHTFPFMWRFHEVHHSLREMNGVNSNHHFTEEIFRIPFITLPLTIFIGIKQGFAPAIVYTIIGLQGMYEHSSTKLHLGWLRYVIADNRFHRIHHTICREDWGHNYGSFTSVWDIVFRTAKFPKRGEWPEVGMPYIDEPKSLREFLWMPFRKRNHPMIPEEPSQSYSAAGNDLVTKEAT